MLWGSAIGLVALTGISAVLFTSILLQLGRIEKRLRDTELEIMMLKYPHRVKP
jgi:hypothetical protein